MLSLQSIIQSLPFLRKALANSNSQLLQIIHEVRKHILANAVFVLCIPQMISDNRLALIADLVADHLNDAVGSNKVWIMGSVVVPVDPTIQLGRSCSNQC